MVDFPADGKPVNHTAKPGLRWVSPHDWELPDIYKLVLLKDMYRLLGVERYYACAATSCPERLAAVHVSPANQRGDRVMRGGAAACLELVFTCKMRACGRHALVSTRNGTVIAVDHEFNVSLVHSARRSACCHMTTPFKRAKEWLATRSASATAAGATVPRRLDGSPTLRVRSSRPVSIRCRRHTATPRAWAAYEVWRSAAPIG